MAPMMPEQEEFVSTVGAAGAWHHDKSAQMLKEALRRAPNDSRHLLNPLGTVARAVTGHFERAASVRELGKGEVDGGGSHEEHCGWLLKRGRVVRNWKMRWVMVQAGYLWYFQDESRHELHGRMTLSSGIVRHGKPTLRNLEVESEQRTLFLLAADEVEAQAWARVLTRCIHEAKERSLQLSVATPALVELPELIDLLVSTGRQRTPSAEEAGVAAGLTEAAAEAGSAAAEGSARAAALEEVSAVSAKADAVGAIVVTGSCTTSAGDEDTYQVLCSQQEVDLCVFLLAVHTYGVPAGEVAQLLLARYSPECGTGTTISPSAAVNKGTQRSRRRIAYILLRWAQLHPFDFTAGGAGALRSLWQLAAADGYMAELGLHIGVSLADRQLQPPELVAVATATGTPAAMVSAVKEEANEASEARTSSKCEAVERAVAADAAEAFGASEGIALDKPAVEGFSRKMREERLREHCRRLQAVVGDVDITDVVEIGGQNEVIEKGLMTSVANELSSYLGAECGEAEGHREGGSVGRCRDDSPRSTDTDFVYEDRPSYGEKGRAAVTKEASAASDQAVEASPVRVTEKQSVLLHPDTGIWRPFLAVAAGPAKESGAALQVSERPIGSLTLRELHVCLHCLGQRPSVGSARSPIRRSLSTKRTLSGSEPAASHGPLHGSRSRGRIGVAASEKGCAATDGSPAQMARLGVQLVSALATPLPPGSVCANQWLAVPPLALAKYLTLCDERLARRIGLRHLLSVSFPKLWKQLPASLTTDVPGSDSLTPTPSPVQQCTAFFNDVATLIASALVSTPRLRVRVALYEHFVAVASELRTLCNFSSCQAILAGLGYASIYRLKATKARLSKPALAALDACQRLMAHDGSYRQYRAMLSSLRRSPPFVPQLGVHLSDLTFLGEGNKDLVERKINLGKRQLVHSVLAIVLAGRLAAYPFDALPGIGLLIGAAPRLSEKVLYDTSLALEPRASSIEEIERREAELLKEEAARVDGGVTKRLFGQSSASGGGYQCHNLAEAG